ncbi:hypothetical protein CHUAL_001341 [Chamberlinius hualienensis]
MLTFHSWEWCTMMVLFVICISYNFYSPKKEKNDDEDYFEGDSNYCYFDYYEDANSHSVMTAESRLEDV